MFKLQTLMAFLRKDFEDAVRSYTLLFILLGPVLLSVFFARFLNADDIRQPIFYVCQEEPSTFVQALRSTELYRIELEPDWQIALANIKAGRGCGAVRIPKGFDEDLRSHLYPRLDLAVNDASMAQGALAREGLRGALRQLAGQELPADIRLLKTNDYKGESRLAILPIWIVFTCLGGLMVTSSTLVEERENNTLSAVLLAPVSLLEVLLGKVAVGFVLAFVASELVVLLNCPSFSWHLSIVLLLLLGALVAACGGVVLGMFVKSQASAGAVTSLIYMALFVPVALADLSRSMHSLALFLPSWYLFDGLNKVLFAGAGLGELGLNYLILTLVLLLLVVIGARSLDRLRLSK